MDAVPGHDQVDPLGRAHLELAPAAGQLLEQLLGPHPGRIDHFVGADLELTSRLQVAHPHADDPLSFLQEADDAGARGWRGAIVPGPRDRRPCQKRGRLQARRRPRGIPYGLIRLIRVAQLASDVRVLWQAPIGAVSHSASVQVWAMYSEAIQMLLPSTAVAP
jgi:hypothetical protein